MQARDEEVALWAIQNPRKLRSDNGISESHRFPNLTGSILSLLLEWNKHQGFQADDTMLINEQSTVVDYVIYVF